MLSKKHLNLLIKLELTNAEKNKLFWSRRTGKFVNKITGEEYDKSLGCSFTGTVREWYETLVETCIDAANRSYMGKSFNVAVSPDVLTIFECSVLYKPHFQETLYKKIPINFTSDDGKHKIVKYRYEVAVDKMKFESAYEGVFLNQISVYRNDSLERNKVFLFSDDMNQFAVVEILDMDII